MHKILFNPLSKSGKNKKGLKKLIKKLKCDNYQMDDITQIKDIKAFIDDLDDDDKVIIAGGDGTVHYVLNAIQGFTIKQEIFVYSAGTGNDFAKNAQSKGFLTKLNGYIEGLPTVVVNGEPSHFINGAGIGLDAQVCQYINDSNGKGSLAYRMQTVRAFWKYKKCDIAMDVDGKKYAFKKGWLISVMNGKFQGGGVKFAPEAKMNDGVLDICLVHGYSKLMVVFLFVLIIFGKHTKLKRVLMLKGRNIKIEFKEPRPLQMDGEVVRNVTKVEMKG